MFIELDASLIYYINTFLDCVKLATYEIQKKLN